jgi:hypothetical protein
MPLGRPTSNGSTVLHDRANMEYNNNNMGQRYYANVKENTLLVKSSILTSKLEANTLHHIPILKNTVTFSNIYILQTQAF